MAWLQIRMTDEEYAELTARANLAGMTRTKFVKKLCLGPVAFDEEPKIQEYSGVPPTKRPDRGVGEKLRRIIKIGNERWYLNPDGSRERVPD